MLSNFKKEFIEFIIKSNAIQFGEFLTKSNRKSPYFFNSGNFKTGEQINKLGEFYAKLIYESNSKFDAIMGLAYKGIPLATSCCSALYVNYNLNKPFFFNRKETKDHGEKGNIIGHIPKPSEKVIIIEDVLTAGTAIKEIIPILKNELKVSITEIYVAINRCERGSLKNISAAEELKQNYNINLKSILTIKDIKKYLEQTKTNKIHLDSMKKYMDEFCIF